MKNKSISVADIIIVVVILATALAGIIFMNSFSPGGSKVEITVDGKVYKTVSLDLDNKTEIKINDTNVLVIENSAAYMKSADCDDQICVKHDKISNVGETIVCLPNKVVVEIKDSTGVEDAAW